MPSKIAIDAMARHWNDIEAREESLAREKAQLKLRILFAVRNCPLAPKAKRTRVLTGLLREIQATFPIDTQVLDQFAGDFVARVPRYLSRKIFTRSMRYTLRQGAFEAFAAAPLTSYQRDLFRLAVRRTDGAPRVKVVKLKKAKKAA
jgi:hypothetical protein